MSYAMVMAVHFLGSEERMTSTAPTRHESRARNLRRLFDARSIAVVGASDDPDRIGGRPIAFMLQSGYSGRLLPVNPRYETVQGLPCYPDVGALPDDVEVAIVAIAARLVPDTIRALGDKGVAVAVVFSSGFAEAGEAGRRLQDELDRAAHESGVRVLGPNTNGWTSSDAQIIGSFGSTWLRPGSVPLGPGSVSFVTQSGAFGSFVYAMAQDRGVQFRHFVATGNESDISVVELLENLVEDDAVAVLATYIEGLRDGPRFRAVAARARELGKPLVAIKVGRSERAASAAASHTGALVGTDSAYEGVFDECGVIRVEDPGELVDVLQIAAAGLLSPSPRLAVLSISGGTGVWAADQAELLGLPMAELSPATRQRLDDLLPPFGSSLNPVDATAQLVNDPHMLRAALEVLLGDPGVDVCYLAMGLQEGSGERYARDVVAAVQHDSASLLVSWVCGPQALYDRLAEGGIASFRDFRRPLAALAKVATWAEKREQAPAGLTAAPVPPDAQDTAGEPTSPGPPVAEDVAKRRLREVGLPVPASAVIASRSDLAPALAAIPTPVVMKVAAPGVVLHKTDAGLVRVGLATVAAAEQAFDEMAGRAGLIGSDCYLFVEQQASPGVELIVSLIRDPTFGWQVVVGLGGELVELLAESVIRCAPLSSADARALLASNERISAILAGVRGRPAADVDALCGLLVEVSLLPWRTAGADLHQLELNPVRVHPRGEGVTILDAVWHTAATTHGKADVESDHE
ncbi:acetate--CoA ligase family protein [Pseudonocardia kujensis]|uniref:acetate--CoA ligase family protein n=1 Tax=Pseudonocardia kujensis TaxID=1128675 RepID=UPI001E36A457|nr:acetate--CoA ligase family protein [Pseudonocardia kujensis]MCE0764087.1 acetate--CoA ligase family protein [Pseudonocardia kujensis]